MASAAESRGARRDWERATQPAIILARLKSASCPSRRLSSLAHATAIEMTVSLQYSIQYSIRLFAVRLRCSTAALLLATLTGGCGSDHNSSARDVSAPPDADELALLGAAIRFVEYDGEDEVAEFRLENRSAESIWYGGYGGRGSPYYHFEKRVDGELVPVKLGWCGVGLGRQELLPGDSRDFRVGLSRLSGGVESFRVGVRVSPEPALNMRDMVWSREVSPSSMPVHAVSVRFDVTGTDYRDCKELIDVLSLIETLKTRLEVENAGMLHDDRISDGQCTLSMHGPDADRLFTAIRPVLAEASVTEGGYAVKRYGAPGASEARVEFE